MATKIFCFIMLMFVCSLTLTVNGQTPLGANQYPTEKWHVYYVAVEKDSVYYFGYTPVQILAGGDSIMFYNKSQKKVCLKVDKYYLDKEYITNESVIRFKRGIN